MTRKSYFQVEKPSVAIIRCHSIFGVVTHIISVINSILIPKPSSNIVAGGVAVRSRITILAFLFHMSGALAVAAQQDGQQNGAQSFGHGGDAVSV